MTTHQGPARSASTRTRRAALLGLILLAGGTAYYWRARRTEMPTLPPRPTADDVLAELRRGNERFVHSARVVSTDTAHDAARRHETAQGQHPIAAVLCCSDSRVCPEIIFDQQEGTFFEIRNAGNVVDDDVLGSLEYAVEHLHVPVVLVMGHKGCGAVEAVCAAGEKPLHDHLHSLQEHMTGIRGHLKPGAPCAPELLVKLCKENARQQSLAILRESHPVKEAVDNHATHLLYALYDLETGAVEFFELR